MRVNKSKHKSHKCRGTRFCRYYILQEFLLFVLKIFQKKKKTLIVMKMQILTRSLTHLLLHATLALLHYSSGLALRRRRKHDEKDVRAFPEVRQLMIDSPYVPGVHSESEWGGCVGGVLMDVWLRDVGERGGRSLMPKGL